MTGPSSKLILLVISYLRHDILLYTHTHTQTHIYILRRRPIAPLFNSLTDRLENRMENWAKGAYNWTIVCDFEESDGV